MAILAAVFLFLLGALAAPAHTTSESKYEPIKPRQTCGHVIDGVGTFMESAVYTFEGDTLPAGLLASTDQLIPDEQWGAPFNHFFDSSNVAVQDGFAEVRVPGGQDPSSDPQRAIHSGEIFTLESQILYASVRTAAILSTEPGTCQGLFFYKSENQETDIEYLSDINSLSNIGWEDGPPPLHYTNQAVLEGGEKSWTRGPTPADVSSVHWYRIDWTPDYTAFFVDDVEQRRHTENVPSVPGTWLWNNWSNGDPGWSVGPPLGDSALKIQTIEMYYNTSSSSTGC
ncbi:uncharacterized protein Z518_08938 [Rhinocladiella mackenziei CBS 650.93]|uniref:GH16 domain-containing protein n=1 Tax=Rhinocladiella mackenziei CBS 650.93 TaxID=1442369 RepID=A0A0D2GSA1_9EURO|nr:uncharacterized protein Z518_08938 [Rhinocladiella mackenziei CBS 650.93]KIX01213.1 hypothetical protein Z518_08938 [Rhinocladiella mackenziei CBS 650.93]